MARVKFSHDIDEGMREQFNQLADKLPGKKQEIVEAMIVAFKSLPDRIQEQLLSKRPEVRSAAIALLAGLQAVPAPAKGTRKTSVSKVG